MSSTSKNSCKLRRVHEQAVDEADHLLEPADQHRGDGHEADDLADRGEADQLEIGPDQEDREQRERGARRGSARRRPPTTTAPASARAAASSTRPRSADTSSSTRAKLCTTRDIAERVGGGLGEVGVMPLDRALHARRPCA